MLEGGYPIGLTIKVDHGTVGCEVRFRTKGGDACYQFKGGDDVRQDAVMEQVFEVCNKVLDRDRETRRRQLSIRSYKVIPLAAQAGILEFVGDTIPLQTWLSIAHQK